MPSFSLPRLFTLPGAAILHDPVLHAFQPPLVALGITLALGLIGWATGARWLVANAAAAGALAGWMALLPASAALRAVLTPRAMADFLLFPAAVVLVAGLAAPWLRGRAERWLPLALAVLAGWWLAGSSPARPEFWRAWFVVSLAAWLLARSVAKPGVGKQGVAERGSAGAGGRVLAAALALWGGLLVAGAPPVWLAAALAAAAAALAAWPLGGALPALLLATVAAAADLGNGRLVRGGLNPADLACLLASGAVWLVPWLTTRFGKRLGRAGTVLAVPAAAALTAGAVWLGARLLHRS